MDSGAWRSIDDLEDNLTIEELYFLYEGVQKREYNSLRAMAMAQGAEMPPWEVASRGDDTPILKDAQDIAMMPISLGYVRKD